VQVFALLLVAGSVTIVGASGSATSGTFGALLLLLYVVPLFVVGLWTGVRDGLAAAPALAASTTPIVVFVLALAAFGGPVLTAVESPLLVVGAVVFWSLVCGVGNVVGATVLGPRLRG
jgi:hypothetical protein